jgi:hypothetical protein
MAALPAAVTVFTDAKVFTGRGEDDFASAFRIRDRIEAAHEGSFLVLERDPFTIAEDDLSRVRVAQTWIRGELAYRR